MAYVKFAEIYDEVMKAVDYPRWAEYVLRLADQFGFETEPLLNLACGTGSLEIELFKRGVREIVSVDVSREMLKVAKRKFRGRKTVKPQFIRAKMQDFDLDRRFPLITCLYDSANYLICEEDLLGFLICAKRHLLPEGGLIFDVTTEYNIIAHFADSVFFENRPDYSYIWENSYNIQTKIIVSRVTIFSRNGNLFHRDVEDHLQCIYPTRRVKELVKEAGFELLGAFHEFTLAAPRHDSERVHLVARNRRPSS